MNVLFLGSGSFALPSLEATARRSSRHPLVGVVTRPDRPRGRGRKLYPTPVKERALELGARCLTPRTVNDESFLAELRSLAVDLIVVADYGELLRRPFLELPSIGAFNVHASLLPKYRGAAPVAYALLERESVTGVTIFRIEEALDSGPIVAQAATEIGPEETAGELESRLAVLGGKLLETTLDDFASGSYTESPQDHSRATRAPKLTKGMGLIDWRRPPEELHAVVRAYQPWPLAHSYLRPREGKRRKAERTAFLRVAPEPGDAGSAGAGSVIEVSRDDFRVACGGGSVRVLELQREGRSAMPASAYLRGRPLRVGDRFSGPAGP